MTSAASSRTFRALLAAGVAGAMALTSLGTVEASSHREAPLIAEDPVADNTDTYAFVSPANPDNTVLIANYIPLQTPDGGPNFYNFGDDVLYEVKVDNTGDGVEDVTFEFDFTTTFTDPNSFLYAFGPIDSLDSPAWNLRQSYTLSVEKDGVRTVLGQDLVVPPNNIGPRTTPNYAALSDAAITTVNDGGTDIQVFAGQKDDPFWVDLGSIFDLGALRPLESLHLIDQPQTDPVDAVAGKNVHSLAIEVPSEYLTASADQPVIGVWATASRRQVRTFAGGNSATPMYTGPFRQVSRLGNPLVNEVVIPLGLKDAFNTLSPSQDAAVLAGVTLERASGADSTLGAVPVVTDPELKDLFPVLYPAAFTGDNPPFSVPDNFDWPFAEDLEGPDDTTASGREDIAAVFLTGVRDLDGNNVNVIPGGIPAEYIRLNTAVPPSHEDPNDVNPYGVFGGENNVVLLGEGAEADGFPNGRRLADDVTNIALITVAGAIPNTVNGTPQQTAPLSDGTLTNDLPFLTGFPYLAHAHSGYYTPELSPTENNL